MYKVFGSGNDSSHTYKFHDDDFFECILYVMHIINCDKAGLQYHINYRTEMFDEDHNVIKSMMEFTNPNQYKIKFIIIIKV